MKKILITGCTGFIGNAFLTKVLLDDSYTPIIAVRHLLNEYKDIQQLVISDLTQPIDWSQGLHNTDVIVHLAARAHILKETEENPLQAFRKVNVEVTINLAKQALAAGVKRFIFISSIGVNGIFSNQPFTELDTANPISDYARSKFEAEQALWALTKNTSMELVIIRPPLVYGEGVKANFLSLIRWVNRGIPLPLGLVKNKRSLVSVDNLVDLLIKVLEHPKAANQLFLVSDGHDLSTPELLKSVAHHLHKPIRLLPVPVSLLKASARLLSKQTMAIQLCDSLQVDITKARQLLGWEPPVSFDHALQKTMASFLKETG